MEGRSRHSATDRKDMEGCYCPSAAGRKDIEGRSHHSVVDHEDVPMWKTFPLWHYRSRGVGRTLLYY